MRAISTVLDATLCLLLVSASVLTLASTPTRYEMESNVAPDTADETAETLATSTARVTFRTHDRNRTAHDTLAGLLASAALADARAGDSANGASIPPFVRAVTAKVSRALRRAQVGVRVVARSTASNASPGGRVVAGESPPADADVHAAAFEVRRVRLTVRTWDR